MSDAGTSHARLLSRTNMATGAQCRMPLAQKSNGDGKRGRRRPYIITMITIISIRSMISKCQ